VRGTPQDFEPFTPRAMLCYQFSRPPAAALELVACGDVFRMLGEGVQCVILAGNCSLVRCRFRLREALDYGVTPGIDFPPFSIITLLSSIARLLMSYSEAYWSA
jgi:hypothetical protein